MTAALLISVVLLLLIVPFGWGFIQSGSSSDSSLPCSLKAWLFLRARSSSKLGALRDAVNKEEARLIKNKLMQFFDSDDSLQGNIYACPDTKEPLTYHARYYGERPERLFVEKKHGTKYAITKDYIDFVSPVGQQDSAPHRLGQRFFQTPLISKVYEHGYRQNFGIFGFPGMAEEFEDAKEFFLRANATDTVLDLSCGTGFAARQFARSWAFNRVLAADLSSSMLRETRRGFVKEDLPVPELIRCDSARLPFVRGSISAVHAGAAMHCWPEIHRSLREIHRVLRPGGAFYASTFVQRRFVRRDAARDQGFTLFSSPEEIDQLVKDAGFVYSQLRREGNRCVVVKALKAPTEEALDL